MKHLLLLTALLAFPAHADEPTRIVLDGYQAPACIELVEPMTYKTKRDVSYGKLCFVISGVGYKPQVRIITGGDEYGFSNGVIHDVHPSAYSRQEKE